MMLRRLAYLSLALVAAACASRRGAATRPVERVVMVDNRGFADMHVYVVEGTKRLRLGIATGNTVTKLTLPRSMSTGVRVLRFVCDPIGGNRRSMTQDITAGPDDTITLTIPPG